ncbi:MAG: hypothetical protein COX62_04035, partial [Deltaproteobacteria bacterium CG_4_10_14_0_2_um_filter_43_8]
SYASQHRAHAPQMQEQRQSEIPGLDAAPSYPVAATRHAPEPEKIEESFGGRHLNDAPAKEVEREVGVLEYHNDQYDIPTFLRKQAD